MLADLWCRDMAMPTKPIEQTTGLSLKTQPSASEVQAFIEASLDPAPLAFSQRITQPLSAPIAASHLIVGLFIVCLAGLLLLACQFGSGGWSAVG
jgi:hypothetical protein